MFRWINKFLDNSSFFLVLTSLLGLTLFLPLLSKLPLITNLFFMLIMLSGINAAVEEKVPWYAVAFGIISIILGWVDYFIDFPGLTLFRASFQVIFMIYVLIIIINSIFKTRVIDANDIAGAVAGYLLLAIIFSVFYDVMYVLDPNSFRISLDGENPQNDYYEFIYFSFVTITTLGYGDITPAEPFPKAVVMLEAVIGQAYMTILLAFLVSRFSQWKKPKAP